MEFYRLNYSLAIFAPEANLKGKTEDRNSLASRAGISGTADKPLLLQLLDAIAQKGNYDKAPSPSKEAPLMPKLDQIKPI